MNHCKITVALAAYNPRIDYLKRVLEGLKNQDFPIEEWEFLIIDNNSKCDYLNEIDIKWHPNFRWYNEPLQGLAQVRRKSFEEACGELVIVTDDDLIFSPGYLSNAWAIFKSYPLIGVYGTQLTPEFEIPPRLAMHYYQTAERKVSQTVWSNNVSDYSSTPWGAGMCIRREVADKYLQILYKEPFRLELGRKGSKRLSCEDMDISFFTCSIGYGKGMFEELIATHLVPEAKMSENHLIENVYWNTYSYSIQNFLLFKQWPIGSSKWTTRLAQYLRVFTMPLLDRKFENAKRKAKENASRDIKKGEYEF